jgi:acyl-CoA reductase-like NAD-dependent aldehyde dehydrogenase
MTDFFNDFSMTIDGRAWETPHTVPVVNPATGRPIAHAPAGGAEVAEAAVSAATRAFPTWRATPLEERQALVRHIGERLQAHAADFARLLTSEQGKPLVEAQAEVMRAAAWCRAFADMHVPDEAFTDVNGRRYIVERLPVGPVAGLVPWNFPVTLALWKVAPALVAGCTMVLKPSPFTPLCALKLGELLRPLLPPGVLNVISGDDQLGPLLTSHAGIAKIAFTGSTATGRKVMAAASAHLTRLTLELGGNDAAIVLPDADVDSVAPQLFWGAFRNVGQFCLAIKRLYVHRSIQARLVDALVGYAQTVKIGNGLDPGVMLGPIQNRPQLDRVQRIVDDSRTNGHRLISVGSVPDEGFFLPVHFAIDPPDASPVVVEEAFGPILPVLGYDSIEEVVARANDSDYGLGGSVWGTDRTLAHAVARQLDTGTVWINDIHALSPLAPLAPHKQSGLGVENGVHGLGEYLRFRTRIEMADV